METRRFTPIEAEHASQIIIENLRFFYSQASDLEEYCDSYKPESLLERSHSVDFYVIEENGELLGIGGIKENEITSLYIKKGQQGKGIGKSFLQFLEGIIRTAGHKQVILKSGSHAIEFYKKQGYTETGVVYSDDEDFEMIKEFI